MCGSARDGVAVAAYAQGLGGRDGVSLAGAGTETSGVVRCDQPRALDLGARGGKKLETVPDAIMDEVLAKLAPIFE